MDTQNEPMEDGLDAARGLAWGCLICSPLWIAVIYVVLKAIFK
jgi:hypothetical protein